MTTEFLIKRLKYPMPRVEDLYYNLAGGNVFYNFDLSNAYQQILLDAVSHKLTTINI